MTAKTVNLSALSDYDYENRPLCHTVRLSDCCSHDILITDTSNFDCFMDLHVQTGFLNNFVVCKRLSGIEIWTLTGYLIRNLCPCLCFLFVRSCRKGCASQNVSCAQGDSNSRDYFNSSEKRVLLFRGCTSNCYPKSRSCHNPRT